MANGPIGFNPTGANSGSMDSVFDARSLNNLKNEAKAKPGSKGYDDAIDKAAKQFESVFLQWALKSMRQATIKGGLFDDNATKQYQSMFDEQLVQGISGKGLGLASEIARQLRKESGMGQTPATPIPVEQALTLRKTSR